MSSDPDHHYIAGERWPVEILVFRVDARHVDEFLRIDHEVWTLGEAYAEGLDRIPFLSKEVWLDDSHPGEVTLVFVWESMATWESVDTESLQTALQAEFDARFPYDVELVRAIHDERDKGIHRWSRFERIDPSSR